MVSHENIDVQGEDYSENLRGRRIGSGPTRRLQLGTLAALLLLALAPWLWSGTTPAFDCAWGLLLRMVWACILPIAVLHATSAQPTTAPRAAEASFVRDNSFASLAATELRARLSVLRSGTSQPQEMAGAASDATASKEVLLERLQKVLQELRVLHLAGQLETFFTTEFSLARPAERP